MAQRAYSQTESMIQEKKVLLERMQKQEELSDKKEKSGSSTGLFGKMASIFSGSEDRGKTQVQPIEGFTHSNTCFIEIVLLQTEIEQLEGLAVNMKSDLDELERGRVCLLH